MIADPVREPDAYRRSLLTALGGQDPIAVLAAGPQAARDLLASAGSLAFVRPEPLEWSVRECLAHLADGELVVAARMRWIAAEDEPDIIGYDQDLWVSNLRQADEDPEIFLAAFEANRRWNLALWDRLSPAERARVGIHRERGPESIELMIRLGAGHDIVHLDQARRALETARRPADRPFRPHPPFRPDPPCLRTGCPLTRWRRGPLARPDRTRHLDLGATRRRRVR